jgi:hypothetical protein
MGGRGGGGMGSQGHASNAVARPGGDSSLDDSVRLFIQLDQDGENLVFAEAFPLIRPHHMLFPFFVKAWRPPWPILHIFVDSFFSLLSFRERCVYRSLTVQYRCTCRGYSLFFDSQKDSYVANFLSLDSQAMVILTSTSFPRLCTVCSTMMLTGTAGSVLQNILELSGRYNWRCRWTSSAATSTDRTPSLMAWTAAGMRVFHERLCLWNESPRLGWPELQLCMHLARACLPSRSITHTWHHTCMLSGARWDTSTMEAVALQTHTALATSMPLHARTWRLARWWSFRMPHSSRCSRLVQNVAQTLRPVCSSTAESQK